MVTIVTSCSRHPLGPGDWVAVATHKPISLAEHVVLALLAEEARHGWAIVRELAPVGELGRIWSLSRPLAYRAMDGLETRTARTRGRHRAGPRAVAHDSDHDRVRTA